MISNLYSTTLAQMYECSLRNDKEQYKILSEHINELDLIEGFTDHHLHLKTAIIFESMNNFRTFSNPIDKRKTTNEYSTTHTWVRREMSSLIGLDVIDKFSSLESGRRPDFLVLDNGIKYPVECKMVFTKRALNQLQQYMIEMNVNKGYAVALKKTIELPDNIVFIQASDIQS